MTTPVIPDDAYVSSANAAPDAHKERGDSWKPVSTAPLGKMVWLEGGGWLHPWAGKIINQKTGECVLDSPTPEHPVDKHFAIYWIPLRGMLP